MERRNYGYKTPDGNSSHAYLLPAVFAALDDAFPVSGRRARLLDLGCGNGFVTQQLADRGYDVVGIDVAEDGITQARKAHPGLEFKLASLNDDDLAAAVGRDFDGVVALEVVEHLFFPKRLFEQCHALLRPGGALIVSTPYHGYLKNLALSLTDHWDAHFGVGWDGGHIKFFSKKTLALMAETGGFHDLSFRYAGRVPALWKAMILTARR